MSAVTKEARLSIRYPDFDIIDNIEINANRSGIRKNAWVKDAITEKLARDSLMHSLAEERLKGDFETRKLLRLIAGPELTAQAQADVEDYLEEVKRRG